MKKNNVTCERCGKHQSVNSTIRFNIHVPPYAYYGYNICRNCYNKYKEFMDELGRTELLADSHSCATCKYCDKRATDEPCMDCDPRKDAPNNHWEADDDN